jgi:hypothetical protein
MCLVSATIAHVMLDGSTLAKRLIYFGGSGFESQRVQALLTFSDLDFDFSTLIFLLFASIYTTCKAECISL